MIPLAYIVHVDLEVFKSLTARISADGQSHNDVLRELLNLDSPVEPDQPASIFEQTSDIFEQAKAQYSGRFFSRGLSLPSGTELKARYKGKQYSAAIINGKWIDSEGREHSSPSAAAGAITETMVNGLRFWEGKIPGDSGWRRLDIIRDRQQS